MRICTTCRTTLFSKRDFADDVARTSADVRAYTALVSFQAGIRTMMPRFQRMLVTLQDASIMPTTEQLADATRTRKRLMDAFSQYDATAKRIARLPTDSPTQRRLQDKIALSANYFLQAYMLPLKSLPHVLSRRGPGIQRRADIPVICAAAVVGGPLGAGARTTEEALAVSEEDAARAAAEADEKRIKEAAMVLEEQRFLVREMMTDASKRRRFDEVAAMAASLKELDVEIEKMRAEADALV